MKKKHFLVIIVLALSVGFIFFRKTYVKKECNIKIGFVLPIQNKALEKIKSGFCMGIPDEYIVDCQNCIGDQIFQYNIIKNMLEKNYNFIVTIGTASGEAAFALCEKLQSKTKIIALAAKNIDTDFAKKSSHIVIEDELKIQDTFKIILELFPKLQSMAMIYSSSEKSIEESQTFEALTKENNIKLKKIMVQSLIDLSVFVKNLDKKIELIFIPKDLLVTSGISIILKKGKELNIPIFVADEGSVEEGATIGFGVSEEKIGSTGANVIKKIINNIKTLKLIKILNKSLFINNETWIFFNEELINQVAKKNNLSICFI